MSAQPQPAVAVGNRRWLPAFVLGAGVLLVAAAIFAGPKVRQWLDQRAAARAKPSPPTVSDHGHNDHDHSHPGHDEAHSIELSAQARKSIGLRVGKVELKPFQRTVAVPAVVVERPGRSELDVTAALSGIVEQIYPIQGQAVVTGQPLFDLRLTHEELVQAQTEFLRTAEELDIVERELARLTPLEAKGAVAYKTLLDRQYERDKLRAAQRSERQGLLLHGLSDEQIDQILKSRKLLQGLTIVVPADQVLPATERVEPARQLFQVHQLLVERGQYVNAGDRLCVLTDHSELYIEGKAFEQDAELLNRVAERGWGIAASFEGQGAKPKTITGLALLYVADKVEPDSRTLRFFVRLPNKLLRDSQTAEGQRFIAWEFKPGQRLQLQVPAETWPDRIVLPADAVVQDGIEYYVFQQNGDHFDRRPVHVEYRDAANVVIANDGSIFPGDTVVTSGAQQMQLGLKSKSGGAVDPHAGHQH